MSDSAWTPEDQARFEAEEQEDSAAERAFNRTQEQERALARWQLALELRANPTFMDRLTEALPFVCDTEETRQERRHR